MYNRYTPKQDGSFQKNRLPENLPNRPAQPPGPSHRPEPSRCPEPQRCPEPSRPQPSQPSCPPAPCPPPKPAPHWEPPRDTGSAFGFLSGLLPKNMDTGDLLMLLILLLLVTDGSENAPGALLTIALFFLMGPSEQGEECR